MAPTIPASDNMSERSEHPPSRSQLPQQTPPPRPPRSHLRPVTPALSPQLPTTRRYPTLLPRPISLPHSLQPVLLTPEPPSPLTPQALPQPLHRAVSDGHLWREPSSHRDEERGHEGKRIRRTPDQKLALVLGYLDDINWTISEFLWMLFRLKDDNENDVPRTQSHGMTVQHFLSGTTKYTPIQIVDAWLRDPKGHATSVNHSEHNLLYSLDSPYTDIKHARQALTSMAAQLVQRQLVREQNRAVKGQSGLAGSAIGKHNHRDIHWDDIGAETISRVNEIIIAHQPLTYKLFVHLASSRRQAKNGESGPERTTRPPDIVSVKMCFTIPLIADITLIDCYRAYQYAGLCTYKLRTALARISFPSIFCDIRTATLV